MSKTLILPQTLLQNRPNKINFLLGLSIGPGWPEVQLDWPKKWTG